MSRRVAMSYACGDSCNDVNVMSTIDQAFVLLLRKKMRCSEPEMPKICTLFLSFFVRIASFNPEC